MDKPEIKDTEISNKSLPQIISIIKKNNCWFNKLVSFSKKKLGNLVIKKTRQNGLVTQTNSRDFYTAYLFVLDDDLIDDSVDKGDQVVKETLVEALLSVPKQFVGQV